MIITVWRHGAAGRAVSDRQRELTDSGFDDIGFGCHQLHEACEARDIPAPELILYSPWVRTAQTAEIIAAAFTHAKSGALEALRPGTGPQAIDNALGALLDPVTAPCHLVLVTHQPLVSALVDHYLGVAGSVPFLTPGGFAVLRMTVAAAACAQLLFWAVPPEYEAQV